MIYEPGLPGRAGLNVCNAMEIEIEDLQKMGFDFGRLLAICNTEITTKFRKN